jgi:hypothetical protein
MVGVLQWNTDTDTGTVYHQKQHISQKEKQGKRTLRK